MQNPFQRFKDIIPQERLTRLRVSIIGAGGIGAPATLALAKMGVPQIEVWDSDTVGEENLGPQIYGPKEVGIPKVLALSRFIKRHAPWCDLTTKHAMYEGEDLDCDVIVAAVDSLSTRKVIWGAIDNDSRRLLVDPRMGAEVLTVFAVIPAEDHEWYPAELEGEALEATCTSKATFHCGLVSGAMVAQAVKAWVVNEQQHVEYTMDLRFISLLTLDRETKKSIAAEQAAAA
jgi:molybdopterin/thiamine biosynthesis adenylyltransferase